jgi:hypothetical protein
MTRVATLTRIERNKNPRPPFYSLALNPPCGTWRKARPSLCRPAGKRLK